MIDVSIITLNYKEAELTKKCIKGLLRSQGIKFEIILIDNSCDKNQEKILKRIRDKRVRVYIMNENLGCAKGYNLGIQNAKGKYIFIINNDAEIDNPQGILKMKKFMDNNRQTAVIQPKIKSSKNRDKFDYAGASGGYIDIYGYPFCRGRIFQTLEKDDNQYNDIIDISWASTCAFFANKNIIKKVGLFDPIYFAYAEEVDISIKIWNSGYRIKIFPDTSVYHRGEASWKKMRAKKTYLIHRNHLILFFKCFSLTEIVFLLPLRIFYEFISIGFYIMTARSHLILPIFQAYISILILIPKIIKQRRIFFKNFKENSMPKFKRSIIIFYYLQKKRKFSILNKKFLYG